MKLEKLLPLVLKGSIEKTDKDPGALLIEYLGKLRMKEIVHSYLQHRFDARQVSIDENMKIVQALMIESL